MKALFAIQLVVGVLMIFMAGIESARPYALLDHFLTSEQLLDEKIQDAALQVMQRSQGYDSVCWLIGGLIVSATAMIGLNFRGRAGEARR